MNDLIARLRACCECEQAPLGPLLDDAADALEQLQRENNQLRMHIDKRAAGVDPLTQQLRERAEAAEAELARVKGLLKKAREEVEFWTPDESNALPSEHSWLNDWYALRDEIDAAMQGRK